MTRIHRTEALCLRMSPSGQTSRVVTWLSAEFGCLKTLVKGSCRPKSAFLGQFDLYYSCELLFYARNADRLNIARECTPLRLRETLRSNWRAGAAASYLCDLTGRVCPPDLEAAVAHQSLNAALDGLAADENPLVLLLWFECRLLAIQGLAPQLSPCPLCRADAPDPDGTQRFSLGAGRLVCHHQPLSGGPEDTVALPAAVTRVLREWQTRLIPPDCERMPTADTLLGLRRFLGLFIMYHIEPLAAPRRIALTLLNTCS